jgi:signal transduction histidine kinase
MHGAPDMTTSQKKSATRAGRLLVRPSNVRHSTDKRSIQNQNPSQASAQPQQQRFSIGGGEMVERIRTFEWASTGLGISSWSERVRTTVRHLHRYRVGVAEKTGRRASNRPLRSGNRLLRSAGWRRYAIALAAFLFSVSLREALNPWLSDRDFIVFLPAVILTTLFAGLGPAILTALLSAVAVWYFFSPPFYSFRLDIDSAVGFATFVFSSAAGIILVQWLRITNDWLEAERARAEQAEAHIAADLLDMTRLNQLSHQLVRAGSEVNKCLNEVIETAIAILGADKGNVQLLDSASGTLTIAAQRGFEDPFLKFFAHVRDDHSACAAAMRSAARVIVEDVTSSEIFAGKPSQNVLINAGVRAVISTPLTSSAGNLLGMISTHFSNPHRPSERELHLLDLLARQTADHLQRRRAEEIEEKKHIEEALREAQEELARATRLTAMGQLTASIAHEINQPLSAIVANSATCLHWLGINKPDLGKARAAAERMSRDARHASDIVAHIRSLMNKTVSERTLVDINQLIQDVLDLTHGDMRKRKVSMDIEFSKSIPMIFGDRVQLQQVILNLVLNSIEAMTPVRNRPRHLLVKSQPHGTNDIQISIHDTGVGLDPASAHRVFDAFFTTKPTGTGMGLSICRSIVEAHGGHVFAVPGVPYGAVFMVELPIGSKTLHE